MSFSRRLLHPDEDVIVESRPHWIQLFGVSFLAIVVLVGFVNGFVAWKSAPTWFGIALGCVVLVVGVRLLASIIRWRSAMFVVTSQRIILRSGVLHRVGREIPIGRIEDVTYHQGFLDRLIGSGLLVIESGGDLGVQEVRDIRRPEKVQGLIGRAISEASSPRNGSCSR